MSYQISQLSNTAQWRVTGSYWRVLALSSHVLILHRAVIACYQSASKQSIIYHRPSFLRNGQNFVFEIYFPLDKYRCLPKVKTHFKVELLYWLLYMVYSSSPPKNGSSAKNYKTITQSLNPVWMLPYLEKACACVINFDILREGVHGRLTLWIKGFCQRHTQGVKERGSASTKRNGESEWFPEAERQRSKSLLQFTER